MKFNTLTFMALLTMLSLVTLGCSDTSTDALSSDNDDSVQMLGKKGNGGGGGGGGDTAPRTVEADVVASADWTSESTQIASTCAGEVTENFGVLFRQTGCLNVTPDGSEYSLIDDVQLNVKTKNGFITEVVLRGQQAVGSEGIMHESDPIIINPPVEIIPAGFTFEIRADNVPVWRLSGHLRGKRVEMIGTVAIGDIFYRAP